MSRSQHRGWVSPVLLSDSDQLPERTAPRVEPMAELLLVCSGSANREGEGAGMDPLHFLLWVAQSVRSLVTIKKSPLT